MEKYIKLLEKNGWTVECESPFEIRHEDGSFASLNAAYEILNSLKLRKKLKKKNKKVAEKDLKLFDVYKAPTNNLFIKITNTHSIAIGPKGQFGPDENNPTARYVENDKNSMMVKVGKLKIK